MKRLLLLLLAAGVPASGEILVSHTGIAPPIGPYPSVWTGTDIGGDTGTAFSENDPNTLTIEAKGDSDEDEGFFVSQALSGDVQVVAEFLSFSGTTENFTAGGIRIAQDLTDAPPMVQCAWPAIATNPRVGCKYRLIDGAPVIGGIFGKTGVTIPHCLAITRRSAEQLVNVFESDHDTCADDWELIAEAIPVAFIGEVHAGAHGASHNDAELVAFGFDNLTVSDTITITPDSGPLPECSNLINDDPLEDSLIDMADPGCDSALDTSEVNGDVGPRQGVVYYAGYETGEIQAKGSTPDGAFVRGMAPPLNGTCTPVSSAQTDPPWGKLDGNHYTRVVDSSVFPPRAGSNSLRLMLQKNCDYNQLTGGEVGDIGGPLDKARTPFNVEIILPHGEPVWLNYSLYFPDTMEAETGTNNGFVNMELAMNAGNSALSVVVDRNFDWEWATQFSLDSAGLDRPEGTDHQLTLDIQDYWGPPGKWNDVIIRTVMSPYSGPGPHPGNVLPGSLEVWIDDDGAGPNSGEKVLDLHEPIGGLPDLRGWKFIAEIYKGGYKKRFSSVAGPVVVGVDELRAALEEQGAGYDDVHPNRALCTDDCP